MLNNVQFSHAELSEPHQNSKQIRVSIPRRYIKIGTTSQWSQKQLETALKGVEDGMNLCGAVKRFGYHSRYYTTITQVH